MKRTTTLILATLLASSTAGATPPQTPVVGSATSGAVTKPKVLQTFMAPVTRPATSKELKRLLRAVKAIEDKGVHLTDKKRLKIAKAALAASKATGVDATLLIAVARMESDLRPLQSLGWRCYRRGYSRCMADCGITQHNISGPKAYVRRQCKKLAQDYRLSFLKSAKEIALHIQFCRKHSRWNQPLRRCVLNRYNSGTFYRTDHRCDRRWQYCRKSCPDVRWNDTELSQEQKAHQYKQRKRCQNRCYRVRRKCRARARYWVKVLCFDFGARHGLRSRRNCRLAWSVRDIATKHYRPAKPKPPVRTATR